MHATEISSTHPAPVPSVAIVGCGRIGTLAARAVHEIPGVRLGAVCDVDRVRVERLARDVAAPAFVDYQRMLDATAPTAVVVATPDSRHVEPTLAALRAGCHVFCEMPLTDGVAEARLMVQTARESNRYLAGNYNRRFGFGYALAADLLRQQEIGAIRQMLIQVTDAWPEPAIASRPEAILTTLLTHHVDLVRWLVGEVESVQAAFGEQVSGVIRDCTLTLHCHGGASAIIVGGYRPQQTRTQELAILIGDLGEIRVQDVTRQVEWWTGDPDCRTISQPALFMVGDAFDATITSHLTEFLSRCAEGRAPVVSGDDAVRGLQVVEAAIASHRLQTRVSTPIDDEDTGLGI